MVGGRGLFHPNNIQSLADGVAQAQYSSLLEGLRAVGQARVKGWQTQQIVFVGGTCGSVHVEDDQPRTPLPVCV